MCLSHSTKFRRHRQTFARAHAFYCSQLFGTMKQYHVISRILYSGIQLYNRLFESKPVLVPFIKITQYLLSLTLQSDHLSNCY